MKGYAAQQVRDAEAPHLAAGEPLMARAAAALAAVCEELLAAQGLRLAHARVLVLVGGGNNGGDALFAAAQLAKARVTVELVRTSSRVHEEGLAAALAAGATLLSADPADPAGPAAPEAPAALAKVAARAKAADLIVDGILGTGTSPDPRLRGDARELVAALVAEVSRRRSAPAQPPGAGVAVVAVDIPSGIHPGTGAVPDPAAVLRADVTVTFGGVKAGLLIEPAKSFAGGIRLYDLGLAPDLEKLTPLIDLTEEGGAP